MNPPRVSFILCLSPGMTRARGLEEEYAREREQRMIPKDKGRTPRVAFRDNCFGARIDGGGNGTFMEKNWGGRG